MSNETPVPVISSVYGFIAAGLVASGRIEASRVSAPVKCIHVEIDGEPPDLALVDAVLLVDDAVGNYMPFEPARLRRLLLARAEPTAVGMSPIGGLLLPCGMQDDFGVEVVCTAPGDGSRPLLAPISPGLFRTVHVASARRIPLGEEVAIQGAGVLAFDGDRERALAPGQEARLSIRRDGPRVIDVDAALVAAARAGVFVDRDHWHDGFDHALGDLDCC